MQGPTLNKPGLACAQKVVYRLCCLTVLVGRAETNSNSVSCLKVTAISSYVPYQMPSFPTVLRHVRLLHLCHSTCAHVLTIITGRA